MNCDPQLGLNLEPEGPSTSTVARGGRPTDYEAVFWGRRCFDDFEAAAVGLRGWETHYNNERFSMALQGRTPAEKLAGFSTVPTAL